MQQHTRTLNGEKVNRAACRSDHTHEKNSVEVCSSCRGRELTERL